MLCTITLIHRSFRWKKKILRLKKYIMGQPSISPDRRLRTQCYAELYAALWDVCGSMVDSWVRGGTRAVPSQCSGPPVSFSAGPGFEPGTLCDSPHVSNHLATWAGHERWWKNVHLKSTLILHHHKKWPRQGSNLGPPDLECDSLSIRPHPILGSGMFNTV